MARRKPRTEVQGTIFARRVSNAQELVDAIMAAAAHQDNAPRDLPFNGFVSLIEVDFSKDGQLNIIKRIEPSCRPKH